MRLFHGFNMEIKHNTIPSLCNYFEVVEYF